MNKILAIVGCIFLFATSSSSAQIIEQSKGVDQNVDYSSLSNYGPWDDRNYQITQDDLDYLAPDEAELADPIPAFFRIELRKEFPSLRRSGPAQYPRAAVPLFYKRYGGLLWDGVYIEESKKDDEGGSSLEPHGLVNGEIKLNNVLGANEVTVEINPSNPLQVIAGSNNNGGQEMYYSSDSGENWTIQGVLSNTCCDPTVDWNSDGTIAYAAALSGSIGVSFWRSFDAGHTWVNRVDLTAGGSDKEWVHVDRSPSSPYQDNVYLTYHNNNTLQFARSTNDGTSFDIQAFAAAPKGIGSDITTTSNGDIYYFYGAFSNQTVTLLKSTDGGTTFGSPLTVAATNGNFDWPIPAMETRRAWIYLAADADRSGGPFDGSVYAAWTDTTAAESGTAANNHTVINVAYSRNGGATWTLSNPHPIADSLTVDRFNQWLKVDENGTVHVVFYDTRHSVNRTGVDLYYNHSTDGGVTWETEQRVSSITSANLTDLQEWGDYNGLSVFSLKAIGVWTDNRDGTPIIDSKDVYASDMENPAAAPTFTLASDNLQQQVCKPNDLADLHLTIGQILGFTDPVTLSTNGLPSGFVAGFTTNPVNPPGASVAEISVDGAAANGTHVFEIQGTSGSDTRALSVEVGVFGAPPAATSLTAPADGATGVSISPTLQWAATAQASLYVVEVATDMAFTDIVFTTETAGLQAIVDVPLSSTSTYYWRVRAENACGSGAYSPVFSFVTASLACRTPNLAIPDNNPTGVTDSFIITELGTISDLNVSLDITHTFIGDLSASLKHVATGTVVKLLERPGNPATGNGCSGNNISVILDDAAPTPAEDQCTADPAIAGTHSPTGSLSDFNGEDISGTWNLTVIDSVGSDTGTLDSWCLQFELGGPVPGNPIFNNGFENPPP